MPQLDRFDPSHMDSQLPPSARPEPSPGYYTVLGVLGAGGGLLWLAQVILPLVMLDELRLLVSIPSIRMWAVLVGLNTLALVGLWQLWRFRRRGLWLTLVSAFGLLALYALFLDPVLGLLWLVGPLALLTILPAHWRDMR